MVVVVVIFAESILRLSVSKILSFTDY